MGWATREMTPAAVPFKTLLAPLLNPAQPSLGLRVEKRESNTSFAYLLQ
jgi:hypothetical protein